MSTDPFKRAPAMPSGVAFASLLHSVAGMGDRGAVVVLLGCSFVGLVVAGVLLALAEGPGLLAALASLFLLLALAIGMHAAGVLQMDHARGISPRSLGDALRRGLICIPNLIVLGLALIAAALAVCILIALLLVLCKIPLLGALLFVVVFPLSVIVAGVTITGLVLCGVLSLPAMWMGASVARALAQAFAIVRSRLVEVLLLLVLLGLICLGVGVIAVGVLTAGLVPTLGLSLSIVGFAGLGSGEMLAMAAQGYALDGHAIAGLFGGLLLWALGAALVGQVCLRGLSLVYLRVTDGLDLSASEASLRAAFDDLKRRVAALGGRAPQDAPAPLAAKPQPAVERSAGASIPSARSGDDHVTTMPAARREPEAQPQAQPQASADIELPLGVAPAPAKPRPPGAVPAWQPPRGDALPPGTLPPALPAMSACPHCLSAVALDDAFCGRCGYRLK